MGIRAMKNYKARRGDWRELGVGKECQVKRRRLGHSSRHRNSGQGGTSIKCKGPGVRAARRSVELEEIQVPLESD